MLRVFSNRSSRKKYTRGYVHGQNMVEKIVQKYVVGENKRVRAGEFVSIRPAHVMTHDNTSAVISKFHSILPNLSIKDRSQPVFTLDHNVQDKSAENLSKYNKIQQFAEKHNINFYPAGRGIGHQIMCEEGYAFPGSLVVASDSHSNMYGGVGCLGTPIVRTDAASIWSTSKTWWKVPPVTKVVLEGKLRSGVTGKDVIIALCGLFNKDEVLNNAVEFSGNGVENLSIDERLTIANMTTEWGALAGVFPIDHRTISWLRWRLDVINQRKQENNNNNNNNRITEERISNLEKEVFINNEINADSNAYYHQLISLDLSSVYPHVSGPNHVKVMHRIDKIESEKKKINKAYIVSCVNSRVDDLSQAADVLRGKKIAPHLKMYIAAASSEVEEHSRKRGDWDALIDAGAIPLPAGCGPCIGLGVGLLEDGEVGISATNRNFKGRMGSRNAECFLASPAVVAASALKGYISGLDHHQSDTFGEPVGQLTKSSGSIASGSRSDDAGSVVSVLAGFPEVMEGDLVFCNQDNINTDGIYPGKYTYQENITPQKQAEVVMENYDPNFNTKVKKGDIVIGGYNFGTGSSREQAATALKYKGIQLVLAASFSETYVRNAFNNGYLCIEVPELVEDLRRKVPTTTNTPTVLLNKTVKIDFIKSEITFDSKVYSMPTVGPAAQELIVCGGLESWIRNQIQNN
eukprot:TRINITY_DN1522_c0_g1_i1.p1 TRINITY_DN1522_c0_g1~~TRINITY_DN1522_c0_g1_i1.p1  ORF type:complete len:689 (+),score=187.32 TRINITY_DN1522_c0_g1_i1:3-2069(+)